MKTKKYKLFKTAKKTAKENNLILSKDFFNNNVLFDFSLLDTCYNIPDNDKKAIINSALKNVYASNKIDYYGNELDNFYNYDGMSLYNAHRVYNTHGQRLYVIMELKNLRHRMNERKSIYENYRCTMIEASSGTCEPLNDYEL